MSVWVRGLLVGLAHRKEIYPDPPCIQPQSILFPYPTFLQALISSSASQGWDTNEVVRENEHSLGLSGLSSGSLLPLTSYMSLGNSLASLELYMMFLGSFRFQIYPYLRNQ